MLTIPAPGAVRTMMVSFRRGDYIIEELRTMLKNEGVDAALITSGIGSLDICKLHTITNTGLPPQERYLTLEGPIEVGSLQGSVAGGEPHIKARARSSTSRRCAASRDARKMPPMPQARAR